MLLVGDELAHSLGEEGGFVGREFEGGWGREDVEGLGEGTTVGADHFTGRVVEGEWKVGWERRGGW